MYNKSIKYIGFYDVLSYKNEKRNSCLPATNKMDYIIKSLINNEYGIEIISPSWTTNKAFYKGRKVNITQDINLKLFPTLPWGSKISKATSIGFSFLCLFFYLLFSIKKDEQIIVYHSRWLSMPILLLKKIKKSMILVLEVEEIYNDVKKSRLWGNLEYKLFNIADKYIFPTELLNQKLNDKNKPYAVVHGTYNVEENRNIRFNDNKIHAVYAGTFDPRKGGSIAAEVAEYLPKNYHIHIIGFGTDTDTLSLIDKIEQVSKKSNAVVTYDGLLSGDDFTQFLQKCDIGLCTQMQNEIYNETSFPSKILSYMANGLHVVSVRIKAIEISEIGKDVHYYEKQDPKTIAETIMSIDMRKYYDSRKLINRLDKEFTKHIKKLMDN